MFKVIDDFLDDELFKQIKGVFFSDEFPWYLNSGINNRQEESLDSSERDVYDTQFTHVFYKNNVVQSRLFDYLLPLINKIDPASLVRIKANYLPRADRLIENGYHTDFNPKEFKCKTAVYYINTNDGYTKFETGQIVESVENRFLVFDSEMPHLGTYCTNKVGRILINFNFIEKLDSSLFDD